MCSGWITQCVSARWIIVFKNRLKLSYGLWFSMFLKRRWWLWPFKLKQNHFLFVSSWCPLSSSNASTASWLWTYRTRNHPKAWFCCCCCCLLFVIAPICWPMPFRFYCHNGIPVIWWQQQSERRGGFPEGPPTPCYQTPPGGEKKRSEEAPKIRALIKIYCSTSLWTADMSVIQGPRFEPFHFGNRASVQMWWEKAALVFHVTVLWINFKKKKKSKSNLNMADRRWHRCGYCNLIWGAWPQPHLAVDV